MRYRRHWQQTRRTMKQQTLAMAADQGFEQYRKPTRRDQFLVAMNRIVPWAALCAVVEPHYPKPGNGPRPPIGLERMLRIHFLQHWFNLANIRLRACTSSRRACGNRSSPAIRCAPLCISPPDRARTPPPLYPSQWERHYYHVSSANFK